MEGPVEIRRRDSIRPRLSLSSLDSKHVPNGVVPSTLVNGTLSTGFNANDEEIEETVLAVTCRVCEEEIILDSEEGFVVQCEKCGEATVSKMINNN